MLSKYADMIKQHRPAGYYLNRPHMTANDGVAIFQREINVSRELEGTEALFVFLHECGHVHMRHLVGNGKLTGGAWREEYEADQYAINAMRAARIPVPRERVQHQKKIIRDLIEQSDGKEHPDDAVLKYAYGKQWRKHK